MSKCYNSELPIGPPGPPGPPGESATSAYKVYTALLTQTGTSAPTATVLKNTLGVTPVWSYNDLGSYQLTATGLFLENKTFVIIGNPYEDPFAVNYLGQANRASDDVVNVFTSVLISTIEGEQITFQAVDGVLVNCPFEIRIYP